MLDVLAVSTVGCRLLRERVWTQHVSLGLVQEGGELCLLGCSVGIILGERYGNEGGDDAPPKLPLFN